MSSISIALDGWKLPIYEKHLISAGYKYQIGPGLLGDDPEHISLRIFTNDLDSLEAVLKDCLMDAAHHIHTSIIKG